MITPQIAKEIGEYYMAADNDADNPRVKAAYAAFNRETTRQYFALLAKGLSIRYTTQAAPYQTVGEMTVDVLVYNRLTVSTISPPSHGLMRAAHNERFRVVHDVYGHVLPRAPFGHTGEEQAYAAHYAMYSPVARMALATETRAQNCALHFAIGNNPLTDGLTADVVFPTQKALILPKEYRQP